MCAVPVHARDLGESACRVLFDRAGSILGEKGEHAGAAWTASEPQNQRVGLGVVAALKHPVEIVLVGLIDLIDLEVT